MISPIAQRIGKYIAHLNISRREFAFRLGYTSSEKINRLFRKDGAKPGFDIIEDMANMFVEINVDWLVTGRGEMLKSQRPLASDPLEVVLAQGLEVLQRLNILEKRIMQMESTLAERKEREDN
jgi:hypothetical protein